MKKKQVKDKLTPFDYLKLIYEKKEPNERISSEEFYKNFQPYIILRFLSMDRRVFNQVLILNRFTFHYYKEQDKPLMYNLIKTIIPKLPYKYTKYIKGNKDNKNKYPDEIYNILRKLYGEIYNRKEIDWIVKYVLSNNSSKELKEELKNFLLSSGIDHKELTKYFPELFDKDNTSKVSNAEIRKELKQRIKSLKEQKQKEQIGIVDDLI